MRQQEKIACVKLIENGSYCRLRFNITKHIGENLLFSNPIINLLKVTGKLCFYQFCQKIISLSEINL